MRRQASLPFVFKRSTDRFGAEITSKVETFEGLVHLEGAELRIQWRVATSIDRFGKVIGTEREVGSVREVRLPLEVLSGAIIRRHGLFGRRTCVLLARDLSAFDALAGADALALDHPAEFIIPVRRVDRLLAEEFAAEVALALAELEAPDTLPGPALRPAVSSGTGTTP